MRISIIGFTPNGSKLCKKLQQELESIGYEIGAFSIATYAVEMQLEPVKDGLGQWTGKQFEASQGIIFIGAAGIAVRAIAPFVKNKTSDPAVLVIDEKGKFVIPILSGHIGGANELANKIADCLDAVPVITTATDINHKFAVDVFAKKNNLYISRMDYAKEMSAAVLKEEKIGFYSDFDDMGSIPKDLSLDSNCEYGICISLNDMKRPFRKTLNLVPRIITLGVGCKKGKSFVEIEQFVFQVLRRNSISIHSLINVATIDLKKEEEGLIKFCEKYQLELITYSAEQLRKAKGIYMESDFVNTITGIGNVCERAAELGSGHGIVLQRKIINNGVTISLARKEWSVEFE